MGDSFSSGFVSLEFANVLDSAWVRQTKPVAWLVLTETFIIVRNNPASHTLSPTKSGFSEG